MLTEIVLTARTDHYSTVTVTATLQHRTANAPLLVDGTVIGQGESEGGSAAPRDCCQQLTYNQRRIE